MKRHFIPLLAIGLMTTVQVSAQETVTLTENDKLGYAIGYNLGKNFKSQDIDINLDFLIKGMKDVLSGGETSLSEQEMTDVLNAFRKKQMAKRMAARQALTDGNLKAGQAFLAQNKTKDGVAPIR
jgi:FKBP-type peptidyl-prolyl cis-trans isomerase